MPETLYGSLNMTPIVTNERLAPIATGGGRVHSWLERVEITAAASVGSKYFMARIPSHSIILPQSTVYWDDLGTGGATIDIGDGSYADGLATDIAADTQAGSSAFLEAIGIEEYGLELWQLLGYAADPGGNIDLFFTIATAAASGGGTVVWSLLYVDRG